MPDARDLDVKVRRQSAWLTKITMFALVVLFLATLGSLIYGFRILHEIQDIRAQSPTNTAAAIEQLIVGVNCGRHDDLQVAVNAILEQLEAEGASLEFAHDCPSEDGS